jgi:hypothetical protein
MSLAKTLEKRRAQIAKRSELKILIYDIERMKGSAEVEFWSLSRLQEPPHPRRRCDRMAAHHLHRVALPGRQGHPSSRPSGTTVSSECTQRIWDAFTSADITVGHNSKAFDEKQLNTGWRDLGLTPPSPCKPIDTLSSARARFGDESKTLDALCQRIGLTGKTDRYDVEVARAACAGDKAAQDKTPRLQLRRHRRHRSAVRDAAPVDQVSPPRRAECWHRQGAVPPLCIDQG